MARITALAASDHLDRLRLVLVRTRNPLNIGAAARAMSNFGFSQLRVVRPYDPAFREARSAVGAAELLANAVEYEDLADAVADCTLIVGTTSVGSRELQQPMYSLPEGAKLIRKHLASGPVALLFGSEKIGLTNADLAHCRWLMRIPTRERHRSMNLGQAVAVCLYELTCEDKAAPKMAAPPAATAAELERLTEVLHETLQVSGYLKRSSMTGEEKIRRLVRRLHLAPEDAEALLGMLRQILWKLK